MLKTNRLKFSRGNAKLGKETAIFSLPAGFTCPGADLCLSRANRITGKIKDGPHSQFRCYAATNEALFKNVRKSRWNNLTMLKACKNTHEMVNLILGSIPRKVNLVRIHQSGDFFSQMYFDSWRIVAASRPDVIFYCYTKALPFWIANLGFIPDNFKIVASIGGVYDSLIEKNGLRSARVVFTEQEAKDKGLLIDHDDSLLYDYDQDFAILLHATQPAGTPAAKAWQEIKVNGRGGYKSDYFKQYRSNKNKNAFKKKSNK
jgi:hypothetical protein